METRRVGASFTDPVFVDGVWEAFDREVCRVVAGETKEISKSSSVLGRNVPVDRFSVGGQTSDGESEAGFDDALALEAQCA